MLANWKIKGIAGLMVFSFLAANLAVAGKVDKKKKSHHARVHKHKKVGMGEQVRLEKVKKRPAKKVAQKKGAKERAPTSQSTRGGPTA
jgi:hypothetical protein